MNSAERKDDVTILIAEDDDGHAELIISLFEEIGVRNPVIRFRDGQEAWDFISGDDQVRSLEKGRRYLMLLDIRMPRMEGPELLRLIKSTPGLRNMPVIMLTTTDDPKEISLCYELGCNNYLTKPVAFEKFAEVIKRLGLFLLVISVDRIE